MIISTLPHARYGQPRITELCAPRSSIFPPHVARGYRADAARHIDHRSHYQCSYAKHSSIAYNAVTTTRYFVQPSSHVRRAHYLYRQRYTANLAQRRHNNGALCAPRRCRFLQAHDTTRQNTVVGFLHLGAEAFSHTQGNGIDIQASKLRQRRFISPAIVALITMQGLCIM